MRHLFSMDSDLVKELTRTRGALRFAISIIRKMRVGQRVDSQAAPKILSRQLMDARRKPRCKYAFGDDRHAAGGSFQRHGDDDTYCCDHRRR